MYGIRINFNDGELQEEQFVNFDTLQLAYYLDVDPAEVDNYKESSAAQRTVQALIAFLMDESLQSFTVLGSDYSYDRDDWESVLSVIKERVTNKDNSLPSYKNFRFEIVYFKPEVAVEISMPKS